MAEKRKALLVRLRPEIHKTLADYAAAQGLSMSRAVERMLKEKLGPFAASRRARAADAAARKSMAQQLSGETMKIQIKDSPKPEPHVLKVRIKEN